MKEVSEHPGSQTLDRLLAKQLRYGTWAASAVTGLGILLEMGGLHGWWQDTVGVRLIQGGIAIFIFLPVLRLLSMAGYYVRTRDYLLCVITLTVLVIIAAGFILGVKH